MATINHDKVTEDALKDENFLINGAMFLQACLNTEDYNKLVEDWKNAGGLKNKKWWKFILEKVEVTYKVEEQNNEKM